MSLPWVILGCGGHAQVVADVLRALGESVEGCFDPRPKRTPGDLTLLGNAEVTDRFAPDDVCLANGIGSTRDTRTRASVFERHVEMGYRFGTIVHPAAVVSPLSSMGEGAQVMAGAVLQPYAALGRNVLLNTKASIDHHAVIGDHVHVAPGVTICGEVVVEEGAHVGTGATIAQGVTVGAHAIVGAGAVVLTDVAPGVTVVGVPARSVGG